MDSDNIEEANITKVLNAKIWAQVLVEEGKIKDISHASTYDGFTNLSEAVIFSSDSENPMPFIELNIMPLVAHTQKSIEDIVEAYLFRELHDMPY